MFETEMGTLAINNYLEMHLCYNLLTKYYNITYYIIIYILFIAFI